MILTEPDFTVRTFGRGDEQSLCHHASDRAVWLNLRDRFPHPYTQSDARNWIEFVGTHKPVVNFAIDVDGAVVGGIGVMLQDDVHKHTAELGYWLGREYWGRGIMSRAVAGMTDWYFANLDLMRLHALVFDYNPASARVLEKAGYELEGRLRKSAVKDGRVLDQLVYARLK